MKVTFEQIMDITDDIMSNEIIDTHEVAEKRWIEEEKEWAESYEGARVKIIESEANEFFDPPRPPAHLGRTGILTRFDQGIFKGVFMLHDSAKREDFSGLVVLIKFDDGEQTIALIEEIQLLKEKKS